MIRSTSGAFGSAFAFDSDGLGSNPSLVLNFLHIVTNCEFSNSRFFLKFYAKRLLMTQNEKPQVTKAL